MNNFNNIIKNNNKNPFFSIKTQTDNNTVSTIPIENLIVINNIKSNSINNNNKNKNENNNNLNKNDNSIYKRSFPKNFTNKSRNNINEMKMLQSDSTSTRTHHNTSRNELLYEYSKIYTDKLNSKRRELNLKIKQNANPKITEKAKKIKRNSYKFSDRLYPNNTVINYSEEIYSGNYNIYNKPKKIIKEEIFSFKPKINNNSKKISKNLEKSFNRLTKSLSTNNFNKNNINNIENEYKTSEIENIKFKYNYLKKNYSLNNLKKNNKIIIKSPNNLYERGMESIKSKNLQYLKNEEEKKNLYKNYSYSPNLNKSFYKRNNKNYNIINLDKKNNNINSKDRIQNFYEKNLLWKEKITNKNNQKFVEKYNKQFDECTFSPIISKKIMENDNDFIKKNIIQIAQYVKKRKNFLENKEKEKMNNKKIFFEYKYLNKNIGISNVNKLKKNKSCIIYNFFSE